MHLANRNDAPKGATSATRTAELSALQKRLLEMILHNEAVRRSTQRMCDYRMGVLSLQRPAPSC
jgi:hypothetical protein